MPKGKGTQQRATEHSRERIHMICDHNLVGRWKKDAGRSPNFEIIPNFEASQTFCVSTDPLLTWVLANTCSLHCTSLKDDLKWLQSSSWID